MPYLMFELITKSYIRAFHPLKIEISTMIFIIETMSFCRLDDSISVSERQFSGQ